MTKIISLPQEFVHDINIPSRVKKFICSINFHDPSSTFSSEVKRVWDLLHISYTQFFQANKWCQENNHSYFLSKGAKKLRSYKLNFIPLIRSPHFLLFFSDLFSLPFESQILFAHIFKLCNEENNYKIAYTNKYFESIFNTSRRPIEYHFSLLFKKNVIIKDPASETTTLRVETDEPNVYETVFFKQRIITLSPYFLDLRKNKYPEFYLQSFSREPQNPSEIIEKKTATKHFKELCPTPFAQWTAKAVEFIDKALPIYVKNFNEKADLSMTRVVFLLPILQTYFKDHLLIPKILKNFIDSLTVEEINRLSPKRLEGKIFDLLAEVEMDENKLFSAPLEFPLLSLTQCIKKVEKIYSQIQIKPHYQSSLSISNGMKKIRAKLRPYILKRYPHLKKNYSVRYSHLESCMVLGVFYTLFSISNTLISQLKEIWEKTGVPKTSPIPLEGEDLAHFYLSKIVKHFQTSLTLPMRTFLIEGDFKLFPVTSKMNYSPLSLSIYYSCRFFKNKVYKDINYHRKLRAHMWQEFTQQSPDKRYFFNVNDPTPYLIEYNKNPHSEDEVGEKIYFRGCHPFWKKEHLEYPQVYVDDDLSQLEKSFPRESVYEVKEYIKNLYLTEKIGTLYNLSHWAKTTYDSVSTSNEFIHRTLYKKRRDAFIQAALKQPERFSFSKQNEMLYCTLTHASIVSIENNEWWKEFFNL